MDAFTALIRTRDALHRVDDLLARKSANEQMVEARNVALQALRETAGVSPNDFPVAFPERDLEKFTHALSDILCWARGFMAGCPDDSARHPLGTDELRELNIKLKRALGDLKRD